MLLAKGKKLLQIALDYTRLEEAVELAVIASRLNKDNNIIIEVGTPLIKSEGLRSASIISAATLHMPIVADMKIIDAADTVIAEAASYEYYVHREPGIEALKSVVDAITVIAAAAKETIQVAVKAAHDREILVIADTIAQDPLKAAKRAARLGVDIIELHIGVDTQRILGLTADQLLDLIPLVKRETKLPIAVAGGITPTTARKAVEKGADIVIVGGYIRRHKDPAEAIKELLAAIT